MNWLQSKPTTHGPHEWPSTSRGRYPSLYLIRGGRHFKIGISNDPKERLSVLQTGSPFHLDLVRSWRTPRAIELEKLAHYVLRRYRLAGEWFDIPIKAAILTIEQLLKAYPRNPCNRVELHGNVVFCGKCGHAAFIPNPLPADKRFRCSQCNCKNFIHLVAVADE